VVPEGPGPEYESVAAFGGMHMLADLKAIAKANELCNRHGMDTISCGATIAFATEATERGLIQSELAWGQADRDSGHGRRDAARRGLGDLLAEGSRIAAQRIGGGAAALTVNVKGLEMAMHSPRAYHGWGSAMPRRRAAPATTPPTCTLCWAVSCTRTWP